jgi:hypothetical protein
MWKLRGIRKIYEKGTCLLCGKKDDSVHVLLKCEEVRKLRD